LPKELIAHAEEFLAWVRTDVDADEAA